MVPSSAPPMPRLAALWFGVLAPPLVWLAALQTGYAWAGINCEGLPRPALSGVFLLCFGVTALAGWVAFRAWTRLREPSALEAPHSGWLRFLALSGLVSAGMFAIAMLAFQLPVVFLRPCD